MTHYLNSPYLQFTLDSVKGTWSLHGTHPDSPFIEDAWMRVSYRMGFSSLLRMGKRKFHFVENWINPRISEVEDLSSSHGNIKQIMVEMGPDVNGILYRLEFALMGEHPIFQWRMNLENQGKHPIDVEKIEMLRAGFFPKRKLLPSPGPLSLRYQSKPVGYGAIRPHPEPGDLAFFSNGWQSWSFTGAYGGNDFYRTTRFGLIEGQRWYAGGKIPKREPGRFISDMFGIIGDRKYRTGILAGFLSQVQHFGTIEAYIGDSLYPALSLSVDGDGASLNPGSQISTDWAVIQFLDIDDPKGMAPYLDAVARENEVSSALIHQPPLTGWCSWYHFFQDIDETKLRSNLHSAQAVQDTVPLQMFQIDDGYQMQIGDWLNFNDGFPNGIAPLAKEIKEAGFTPGLWLAPFIVHSKSRLAREQPKWLLRNRLGFPAHAGFQWNNLTKTLDLTHPEALNYVRKLVHTAVHEWGFSYLKLDFLYTAAIKGKHIDRTKTRAQILRMGLEAIREVVGQNVKLLGVGCPIGSGIGIFNSMRIGADVDPCWEPNYASIKPVFQDEPNMPSVRNALQNSLTRAFFHNRWWINDPDCLLIRPDSELTLAEIQSLATAIALTGGPVLLSDDLPQVPPDRLRIAEQLLPLIGKTPWVVDWFDAPTPRLLRLDLKNTTGKWYLIAVYNWADEERDEMLILERLALPHGEYFAREFWCGTADRISDGSLILKGIPAHGVKLVALTPSLSPQDSRKPLYLGGDLHFSQGLEVTQWSVTPQNGVHFSLERYGNTKGEIELYLPQNPTRIILNGLEIEWIALGENRYRIPVEFQNSADIKIV